MDRNFRAAHGSAPAHGAARLIGDTGIWVMIAGDLLVFGLFFATFAWYRIGAAGLFSAAQARLIQRIGLGNTLLLLTSSWFMALAVQRARRGAHAAAARLVGLCLLCGLGFVAAKAVEWSGLIGSGATLNTNDFFMFYFMLTGIHLLHVLIGLGVLLWLRGRLHAVGGRDPVMALETGAVFWHLVDLLWIVLFALFYVAR